MLERNKVRATVDVNGLAVQKWPEAVKALHDAGNEIAGHGTTNDITMTDLSPDEQRKEIREVNRVVKEVIGEQPVGWVSPGGHHTRETLGILADEGYTWCGDQCDDDLPYVVEVDGKRMVIVPKHWFFNDWRAWNGGASSSEMAFQQFKDGFDFVLEEALRGKPGRIDALVHAELGGRPYMANGFEKMIRYVRAARRHRLVPDPRRDRRLRAGEHELRRAVFADGVMASPSPVVLREGGDPNPSSICRRFATSLGHAMVPPSRGRQKRVGCRTDMPLAFLTGGGSLIGEGITARSRRAAGRSRSPTSISISRSRSRRRGRRIAAEALQLDATDRAPVESDHQRSARPSRPYRCADQRRRRHARARHRRRRISPT